MSRPAGRLYGDGAFLMQYRGPATALLGPVICTLSRDGDRLERGAPEDSPEAEEPICHGYGR